MQEAFTKKPLLYINYTILTEIVGTIIKPVYLS